MAAAAAAAGWQKVDFEEDQTSLMAIRLQGAKPCPPGAFEEVMACRDAAQYSFTYFGKKTLLPRGQLFYALNPLALTDYPYSGTKIPSTPMDAISAPVAEMLAAAYATSHQACEALGLAPQAFNGVLLNLYENGRDSVAAHSDDEDVMVPGAPIVTISYGATRQFAVYKKGEGKQYKKFMLADRDVVVMGGTMQTNFEHAITKCANAGPRISLTVRAFRDGL